MNFQKRKENIVHYTLNECFGKLQGEMIDCKGDSLAEAVSHISKFATIQSIYDKARPRERAFTVRQWEHKYIDGNFIPGCIVFIPRSNLRAAREMAGLTQQALADTSGISISHIQKIESGEIKIGNITATNLLALASALSVSPEDLMDRI